MSTQDNMSDDFLSKDEQTESIAKNDENAKASKPIETRIAGWTSLKEFSVECGITYEAVRQQVQKHSAVLEGHIKTIGKTRYLDSYAKKFLRGKKVNGKESTTTSIETTSISTFPSESNTNNESLSKSNESAFSNPVCDHPQESRVDCVIPAELSEKINAQELEIAELTKKIRSLEDEIKQIEYDNVLAQSVIASMNVREFKNWKNKFKSQMRDTMDI